MLTALEIFPLIPTIGGWLTFFAPGFVLRENLRAI